jgi:tRNA nucleotidyltransferase/poly(A) polymerase
VRDTLLGIEPREVDIVVEGDADNRRAGVREGQHCGAIGTAREGVEHDIGAKVNDSEHRLSLGSTR